MARVKLDPDERIRCHVCGAEIKRKSRYTHRQSEPCLLARDKETALALDLKQVASAAIDLGLMRVSGILWKRLRTHFRPQGWGKKSVAEASYFAPTWAADLIYVSFMGPWKPERICLALVAFKGDKQAQDLFLAVKAADDVNAHGQRYDGSLAILSAYVDDLVLVYPSLVDKIRSDLALTAK